MKLLRQSFEEKLKTAEAGDIFVTYSQGVGGWVRNKLARVEWPYLWCDRSQDGWGPWHAGNVHKLEKQNGEEFEKR